MNENQIPSPRWVAQQKIIEEGWQEVARTLRMNVNDVKRLARRRHQGRGKVPTDCMRARVKIIEVLNRRRLSKVRVGIELGLTRERVGQIMRTLAFQRGNEA